MTIDDLTLVTQQEFQHVEERFDRMEEIMGTILHAVENIDVRLSVYASRWDDDFSSLDEKVEEIDGRVRVSEKRSGRKK